MTVTSSTALVSYNGDDSTVEFTVTFGFIANSHIKAILRDSSGSETTWVLDTDYTLSGAGGSSGTLTATTAPADGETLVIKRDMPFTQDTDYVANDPFPAETHEQALDELTMNCQQISEDVSKSIRISDTVTDSPTLELSELAADRGDLLLGFNTAGTSIILTEGTYATAAAASAAAASASETNAATSESNAATSETNAAASAVEAAGYVGASDSIIETGSSVVMNMKVIEIGDWNMNVSVGGTLNVLVAHGLTLSKIRSVQISIRADSGGSGTTADLVGFGSTRGGHFNVQSTNVSMSVIASGPFDTAGFDETSYNRGWITIWYTD